jgi:hypothetical protein
MKKGAAHCTHSEFRMKKGCSPLHSFGTLDEKRVRYTLSELMIGRNERSRGSPCLCRRIGAYGKSREVVLVRAETHRVACIRAAVRWR